MTDMPWNCTALSEWAIVGMNHYHINGERRLFVAMTKNDRCIKAESANEQAVFGQLAYLAREADHETR